MEKFDVAIIGGGMSGIILAISLRKQGINACIIEAKDRIGKKILASGNGKCNILNKDLSLDNYNNDFPRYALDKYNYEKLNELYNSMGLLLKVDSEGRAYPYSESANTVLNVFLDELQKLNTKVFLNTKIDKIEKSKDAFILSGTNFSIQASKVVLASGSNASFGINSHALFSPFSHKATKFEQSLVPIKTNALKGANGVRCKAVASLYINNKLVFKEAGELLFKDNFLSGILAFKMSAYIAREIVKTNSLDAYIEIDFCPEYTEDEINNILDDSPMAHPLCGLLHKAIAFNFEEEDDIAYAIKHHKCKVEGLAGIDNAQVLSGGLVVKDFDDKTMESKLQKGLYAIGEVLDVDGQCGGYNLSFAAASALVCADAIKEELCK
ncbi:MAG: aminoacetone oxidase family FAD-binding enzyme [Clostridia bacterium]|nr:aminoacetone oxidase family FAD-binding enzyme [Clostridia bacterium]